MTNAQNLIKKDGRVYVIGNKINSDLYIGSTHQTINRRKSLHKSEHKRGSCCRSTIVIDAGDWYMIEIEACPNTTKWELQQRERFHILNNPNCVNDKIPSDCKTKKEYRRQYDATPERKAYKNTKIMCDICGCMISRKNIAAHQKTQKCQNVLHGIQ